MRFEVAPNPSIRSARSSVAVGSCESPWYVRSEVASNPSIKSASSPVVVGNCDSSWYVRSEVSPNPSIKSVRSSVVVGSWLSKSLRPYLSASSFDPGGSEFSIGW